MGLEDLVELPTEFALPLLKFATTPRNGGAIARPLQHSPRVTKGIQGFPELGFAGGREQMIEWDSYFSRVLRRWDSDLKALINISIGSLNCRHGSQ
jgi:hypothetical protein